jgi:hypothetical protein
MRMLCQMGIHSYVPWNPHRKDVAATGVGFYQFRKCRFCEKRAMRFVKI